MVREDGLEFIIQISEAKWVLVLKGFFDEAGTDVNSPFTCVGGYLFTSGAALKFKSEWKKRIKTILPKSAPVFHASECFHRVKTFKGISIKKSEEIFEAMAKLIKDTALCGVISGIEHSQFKAAITKQPHLQERIGSDYSMCLLHCAESVGKLMTKRSLKGNALCFFEQGDEHQAEAEYFLNLIINNPKLKKRYRLHAKAFLPKTDAVQLQAADFLAWEFQRCYATALIPNYRDRLWRTALSKSVVPLTGGFLTANTTVLRAMVNHLDGLKTNRKYKRS